MNLKGINPWFAAAGLMLLLYAMAYVALPGYIRFLERGGTSAAGNAFDLDVLIGATKTVVWMYSFQLGVLALILCCAAREKLQSAFILGVAVSWLLVWSWPSLPQPGAWFYILFGGMLLVVIATTLTHPGGTLTTSRSRTLFAMSLLFFAFATWEVCGLGTAGRMLHPDQASSGLAHNLLVTQSSKLMIEFVLAWSFLAAAFYLEKQPRD
jgi:hypothetical protein